MARKFLTPIDLSQLELLNARIQNLATAPSSPVTGQVYFDTTMNVLRTWNGSQWIISTQGTQGTQGPQGTQGVQGPQGTQGIQGVQGVQGPQGTTGLQGSAGYIGADGIQGTQGVQGTTGIQGATGAQGTQGVQGTQGAQGVQGITGVQGLTGVQGTAGSDASVTQGTGITVSGGVVSIDETYTATRAYVDATAQGLDVKQSVRAATTANITLSGTQTIDGVSVGVGDRVLVKNQSTGSENGIYVAASGSWSRASDANVSAEVTAGLFTFVSEGTSNGNTGWVLTTDDTITLDTTSLTFTQFSGAGTYTAGAGLTASGSTFNVGAGTGITVNADDVAVDTTVVARKYTTTIGDGSTTSFTVTHNLGTRGVAVSVYEASSYAEVEVDVAKATTNTVIIGFATAPSSNAYVVAVVG